MVPTSCTNWPLKIVGFDQPAGQKCHQRCSGHRGPYEPYMGSYDQSKLHDQASTSRPKEEAAITLKNAQRKLAGGNLLQTVLEEAKRFTLAAPPTINDRNDKGLIKTDTTLH